MVYWPVITGAVISIFLGSIITGAVMAMDCLAYFQVFKIIPKRNSHVFANVFFTYLFLTD